MKDYADWENLKITERNKELPHVSLTVYNDGKTALVDENKSPWHVSLNGDWNFCYLSWSCS